jgi:hypothetical protein
VGVTVSDGVGVFVCVIVCVDVRVPVGDGL